MKNIDSNGHVTGRSIYLDDIPVQQGTLYALPYDAPSAHAHIKKLDVSKAAAVPGVVRILTYADVTGENQIGGHHSGRTAVRRKGDPLLGHAGGVDHRDFRRHCDRQARKLITIELEELPVITDPREARAKGELIIPPRTFRLGDPGRSPGTECAHVFEGRADTNGQEHLYIETQGAYAYPTEHGSIRISIEHARPNCRSAHDRACIGSSHAQGRSGRDTLGRRLRW
jgi:xanthine dehydrogenase large subunit